ncbi:hypothetical protein B7Z17_02540 [Candidatus Saccharibacteria bacterium 32-49-10]|nr:MAG: hypothetical protein B7Z17_02540 [Candidatus Saccharibacteria bacterium 32-49-10]
MVGYKILTQRVLPADYFVSLRSGVSAHVVLFTEDGFQPTTELLHDLLVDLRGHAGHEARIVIYGAGQFDAGQPDDSFDEMGDPGLLLRIDMRTTSPEEDINSYLERLTKVIQNPETTMQHITTRYHEEREVF